MDADRWAVSRRSRDSAVRACEELASGVHICCRNSVLCCLDTWWKLALSPRYLLWDHASRLVLVFSRFCSWSLGNKVIGRRGEFLQKGSPTAVWFVFLCVALVIEEESGVPMSYTLMGMIPSLYHTRRSGSSSVSPPGESVWGSHTGTRTRDLLIAVRFNWPLCWGTAYFLYGCVAYIVVCFRVCALVLFELVFVCVVVVYHCIAC